MYEFKNEIPKTSNLFIFKWKPINDEPNKINIKNIFI